MGAGGTTAKPRKPPFDPMIGGSFVIVVGGRGNNVKNVQEVFELEQINFRFT